MANFVDERIENLLPCLVKKIEAKMHNREENEKKSMK